MSAYEPAYSNQPSGGGYYNNSAAPAYNGGAYDNSAYYQQPPPQQQNQPYQEAPQQQQYHTPPPQAPPQSYAAPQPTPVHATTSNYTPSSELDFGDEASSKIKCNDPCCAIFFFIVFVGTIGLFGWSIHTYLNMEILYFTYTFNITAGFIGVLIGAVGIGIAAGFALLLILRRFPGKMIKFSIFTMVVLYLGFGALLIALGGILAGILVILMGLLFLVWMWCVRKRIKFSERILKYSIKSIQESWGIFIVTAIETIITGLYSVWWAIGTLYLIAVVFNNKANADGYDAAEGMGGAYVMIYIGCAFCLFLVVETFSNVVHVTTCGVSGVYWFYPPGTQKNPTWASFKRASIWSLGSVVFGSTITSLLRTLRLTLNALANDGSLAAACALCILGCIERLVRFFNTYAFAYIALYGDSYCKSAKSTFDMFKSKGFTIIINDELISIVLTVCSLIGGVAAAGIAGSIYYFGINSDNVGPFFFCFFMGYAVCGIIMTQIYSAAVATIVVWASAPEAINANRPEVYHKLEKARKKFYS